MPRHGLIESDDSPHPLWPHAIPCLQNRNVSSNVARLLYYCGDRLVVVLPDEGDKPGTPAEIYGLTSTGMLSWREGEALVDEAADRYHDDCERVLGPNNREYDLCSAHATRMKNDRVPRALREKMTAVVVGLQNEGALPPWAVIKRRSDIDSDLTTLGTPSGVLDLLGGHILPPDEARERLVATSTEVEYDPGARHPLVDEVLPPVGPDLARDEMAWYRSLILGYGLTHEPSREFMWEICAEDSGKSTFINTLRKALGRGYVPIIRPEVLRPDPKRTATSHNGEIMLLGKPARFAFVMEFEGEIDSGIIKGVSGGDDATFRQIYLGGDVLNVTAHLWFVGNSKDEGGARLGITNNDENTHAILGRAKMLYRETIPNPDKTVVKEQTSDLDFKRAALARLVEYTTACSVLHEFPADPPSTGSLQEAQRQTELADWQQDWLPNAVRPRGPWDTAPNACATSVYEDIKQWWASSGAGRPPAKKLVTQAVNRHHVMAEKVVQGRCPQHGGRVESVFPNFVIAPRPISLAL